MQKICCILQFVILKRTYHFTHYNRVKISNLGLNYWQINLERGVKENSCFSIHVFAFSFL